MNGNLLLIDDDPVFSEITAAAIERRFAITVFRAENGHEGLQLLETHFEEIQFILCDINMPDCDGIEMIERLAQRQIATPVIFISQRSNVLMQAAQVLANARQLNVAGTLSKPLDIGRLADLVQGAAETMVA